MSNDEHQPGEQQPRDFATRKLTDPGATVNLNADDIAALKAAQSQENATRQLSDPGATVSFRAEELAGLSSQPAEGEAPARDRYATVNLSAEDSAQLRRQIEQSSAADVTRMGPSDIVPPGSPIEGPSSTREIGEPLPLDQAASSQPSAAPYSPPAQAAQPPPQGYSQQPPQAAPPPPQGYSQQPPQAAPPPYQGYAPSAAPHEASGPGNFSPSAPKAGSAIGPAQIAIGLGVLLIIIALILALV